MSKLRSEERAGGTQAEKRGRPEHSAAGTAGVKARVGKKECGCWKPGGWSSSPMTIGLRCFRGPLEPSSGVRDQVGTLPPALGRDGHIFPVKPKDTTSYSWSALQHGVWGDNPPGLKEPHSGRVLQFRTATEPQGTSPGKPSKTIWSRGYDPGCTAESPETLGQTPVLWPTLSQTNSIRIPEQGLCHGYFVKLFNDSNEQPWLRITILGHSFFFFNR